MVKFEKSYVLINFHCNNLFMVIISEKQKCVNIKTTLLTVQNRITSF